MGNPDLPTVLVTGFGLFRDHSENSSWITAKQLLNIDHKNYNLVIRELPVIYDVVLDSVPKLWEELKPKLVVHCGMSELATCIAIEKQACNTDYFGCDVKGQLPPNNCCCSVGQNVLHTAIDVDKVLEDLKQHDVCVKTESSDNAGRYLCEFIYYTSLKINRNTAFVHLPPVNQPYTAQQMAQTLSLIISSMLKQITHS
ncbi:pyroglutamyl-peptidase 1 [Parasteatoda tepidariorum]|uniref:pyroglutamyl-peptidase 1 n=1 Tax=Parasteatoda tepidariorum TaxID=114398 RepID=UPI00077FDD7F|nr:pyroglutamyl-peptidase 1 [Parasteatoda tepidariorum]